MILDGLGEMGYEEVWLGEGCVHWTQAYSGLVIASPKQRKYGWPNVWRLDSKYGEMSCGNGLKEADQAQYRWISEPLKGHFVRNGDGTWLKN